MRKTIPLAILVTLVCVARSEAQRPGGRGGFGGFMRMIPVIAALDADADNQLSADEIAGAAAALRTLDKDGDGALSQEELRPTGRPPGFGRGGFGGLPAGGPPPGRRGEGEAQSGRPAESRIERLMRLDSDGDGKLGKDELSGRLQSLLTRADADNDGFVTRDELLGTMDREDGGGNEGPRGDRGRRRGPGGPPAGFERFGGGPPAGAGGFGGPPRPDQLVERALEFDGDDDGKLDREELARFAEQAGPGRFGRGGRRGGRPRPDHPE